MSEPCGRPPLPCSEPAGAAVAAAAPPNRKPMTDGEWPLARSRVVKVDFVQRRRGVLDTRAVVFLHGFPRSHYAFRAQLRGFGADHLAKLFTCGLIDRQSPPPGSPARSAQTRGSRSASRCPPSASHRRPPPRTPHQPGLITQPQHLAQPLTQRRLVPHNEPRNRGVIQRLHHRHRLERHVLIARPLDPPRRPELRPSSPGHTPAVPPHRRDTP